ncbi:TonB-dependent receptor [Mesonia aestuariivivens]|uniref:TonB-dependent receptor n=1 Tax=Mesonia aestuariivivens TaxID=2796128 RepID=A0ABS6VXC5_9FLAO|nr:TonB-dependent receptor [Mesonia aestuariivivens]MBW2960237.1 TonB-dependent receptor [Mesonia aestuariivivens]
MRSFLILCLSCFTFISTYGQEAKIIGKVVDENDRAIPFVSVTIAELNKGVASDMEGNYELQTKKTGEYTFHFSAIGFKKQIKKFRIDKGQNILNISLEKSLEGLDQVVITSNRTRETLDEVPSSVSVLTSKDIENLTQTSNSVADILSTVPGIALSNNQTSSNGQTLRGRNMLILVDGIPQSTPLRKGGRDINSIDPSTIERIEVIKGATAIYGNGADGGIVNYITKKPTSLKKIESTTSINAEGGLKGFNNTVGSKITQTFSGNLDKFSYVASGSVKQTGVYKDANGEVISPFYGLGETSQYSLFGKANYTINDQHSIQLSYNYFSSNQDSKYLAQVGIYRENPTIGVLGEDAGVDQGTRYNHNVQLTYNFNEIYKNTDFKLNLYMQDFKTIYGYTDSFYNPDLGFDGGQSTISSTKKGARFNFNTYYSFGAINGEILYGLDALNDVTSQDLVDGRPWVPKIDMNNLAPYAQLKTMYKNFVFKGGIRFENIKIDIPNYTTLTRYNVGETQPNSGGVAINGGEKDYNATTFNLGLRYNKWGIFKPFVSFSQSFSVADIGRVLRSATANTVSQINSEAVIANNYEAGFNSSFGKTNLSGSYYISTSDLGSTYRETESGAFEILRQPEKVYGFEIALTTEIIKNVGFGTSFSYTEGKIDANNDNSYNTYMGSDRISPIKTVSFISYTWNNRFNARLSHIYSGNRDKFEANENGDYTYGKGPVESFNIFNLTTSYQLSKSTKLSLGIKNLFNEDYYNLISQWAARDSNYIKANGTQFNLGLTVKI